MIKVGQLRDALKGFDPDWDLVIFDLAGTPRPPLLRRPSPKDTRPYKKQNTLEIIADFNAPNVHLLWLDRQEFIYHMTKTLACLEVGDPHSVFLLANTILDAFLRREDVVYGDPKFNWDYSASVNLVMERGK